MAPKVPMAVAANPEVTAIITLNLKDFHILSEEIKSSLYHFKENPFQAIDFPLLNEYTTRINRGRYKNIMENMKKNSEVLLLFIYTAYLFFIIFIKVRTARELTIISVPDIVEASGQFLVTVRCWAMTFPSIVDLVPPTSLGTA